MSIKKINDIIERLDVTKKIILSSENYENEIFSLYRKAYEQCYIFRGLSEDDELLPSVVRKCKKHGGKTIADIREYESSVLKKFSQYSIQYLPYYEMTIDWLAAAQHYGLPTRLIDWTYNLYVGLFFSIGKPNTESKEEDNSYLMVCKSFDKRIIDDFNDYHGVWMDSDPRSKKDILFENYKEIDDGGFSTLDKSRNEYSENICFIKGNDANPRIIRQEGLFQISRIDGDSKETIDEFEKRYLNRYSEIIEKVYIIPRKMGTELRDFLNKKRVTTLKLFPDLQNICKYIIESTTIKD